MNHRARICLLAAATLAACGQPPSPGTPRAMPRAEVTTTTSTEAGTTTVEPPPTTTTTTPPPKPPPPPPPRTTTTKPPPPPPKPPDRWVFPASMRGSIESRDGQKFSSAWGSMVDELANACPGKKLCVGYALVVDPTIVSEQDCYIDENGGIKVPDPLYEKGNITFRVNNKNNCTPG